MLCEFSINSPRQNVDTHSRSLPIFHPPFPIIVAQLRSSGHIPNVSLTYSRSSKSTEPILNQRIQILQIKKPISLSIDSMPCLNQLCANDIDYIIKLTKLIILIK